MVWFTLMECKSNFSVHLSARENTNKPDGRRELSPISTTGAIMNRIMLVLIVKGSEEGEDTGREETGDRLHVSASFSSPNSPFIQTQFPHFLTFCLSLFIILDTPFSLPLASLHYLCAASLYKSVAGEHPSSKWRGPKPHQASPIMWSDVMRSHACGQHVTWSVPLECLQSELITLRTPM